MDTAAELQDSYAYMQVKFTWSPSAGLIES